MEKITVAEARRMRGISQEDAAAALGLSVSGYRKKELGHSKFYVDEATAFCELVNLTRDELYFGENGAQTCTTSAAPDRGEDSSDEEREV